MVYIAVPVLSAAARMFPTFRDMFEAGLDENKRFWENEERREQPKMESIVDAVTVVTYVSSGSNPRRSLTLLLLRQQYASSVGVDLQRPLG
jgi:hypothetical protein